MGSLDSKPNEKSFFWIDDDGVRCSPRHTKLSTALEFFKDPTQRWVTEGGKPKLVDVDRRAFPSQKDPVTLKIAEWVERDLTDEEVKKVDQIKALKAEGLA